jgi:hypothetical protein
MIVITGSRYIEHIADQFDRRMHTQLIDQRIRSMPSDIKSAVAFFKMASSCSRRLMRAYSS